MVYTATFQHYKVHLFGGQIIPCIQVCTYGCTKVIGYWIVMTYACTHLQQMTDADNSILHSAPREAESFHAHLESVHQAQGQRQSR